jgi:uncharacterized membrane protein YeaQ/YmgE (transglycosylase-associated protein family)
MNFIWFVLIGAAAGWLAGQIMKGKGFGVIVNILVGCVGAILGGWLIGILGFTSSGLVGSLITALIGAIVLLYILSLINKK